MRHPTRNAEKPCCNPLLGSIYYSSLCFLYEGRKLRPIEVFGLERAQILTANSGHIQTEQEM
jgi:hypothetical protein